METTVVHWGSIGAQSVGARPFVNITCSGLTPAYVAMSASGQDASHELLSKLLVSPLITPIVVPYIIPYITPFNEFRLWYTWSKALRSRLDLSIFLCI